MAEAPPDRDHKFTAAAALLHKLLAAVEHEHIVIVKRDIIALAAAGETVRLLLEELNDAPLSDLAPHQRAELSGLMERVRRGREQNRRLLEQITQQLEAELKNISREKQAFKVYADQGPAKEIFVRRDC